MKIEINSEVERLTNEIKNLRDELMRLLDEKHDLLYNVCPQLKAKYYEKFGALETEAAMYAEKVKQLSRKLELIRQKTNRGETADLTEINAQIELEFNGSILQEAVAEGETAVEVMEFIEESGDFEPDNAELKKLYKKIALALHPDLHPEFTEQENRLFIDAIDAYERGDIDTIRLIEAVTRTTVPDKNNDGVVDADEEESAVAELLNQRKYIVYGIDTVRGDIAEIKQEFPYNVKATLEDPEKIVEIQERLEQALADYKALYKSYRDDFERLMKENDSE